MRHLIGVYDAIVLNREQTAEALSMSVSNLDRIRKNREGPQYLKIGTSNAKVQYLVADIVEYLVGNRNRGDDYVRKSS